MNHYAGSTPAHSDPVIVKRPARKAKALLPIKSVPVLVFTPIEIRIIEAHRKMDGATQNYIVRLVEGFADSFPRRGAPSLRLVVGGAA